MMPFGICHPPLHSSTRASTMSEVHTSSGTKRPVPVMRARTRDPLSLCVILGASRSRLVSLIRSDAADTSGSRAAAWVSLVLRTTRHFLLGPAPADYARAQEQ